MKCERVKIAFHFLDQMTMWLTFSGSPSPGRSETGGRARRNMASGAWLRRGWNLAPSVFHFRVRFPSARAPGGLVRHPGWSLPSLPEPPEGFGARRRRADGELRLPPDGEGRQGREAAQRPQASGPEVPRLRLLPFRRQRRSKVRLLCFSLL